MSPARGSAREAITLTLQLLGSSGRRTLLLLVVASLVGGALESIGIGVVVPAVAAVTGASNSSGGLRAAVYGLFSGGGLALAGFAVLLVFLIKNSYLALRDYLQFRFVYRRQVTVGRALLRAVLERPYIEHAARASSDVLSNVNDDVRYAHQLALQVVLTLAGELAVGVLVVVLLIALAPLVAAGAIAVFGLAGAGIHVVMRRRTQRLGERQQREHVEMNRHVVHALRTLKQVKLAGREAFFVDAYSHSAERFARAVRFYRAASTLPRHVLETLAALALVLTMLFGSTITGRTASELVPLLALFVVAAVRLTPSVSRIVQAVTTLRYYAPAVRAVHEQLAAGDTAAPRPESPAPLDPLPLERAVALRAVTFRYPGAAAAALDDVSVELRRGEIVGLVGASGAGKSTLADVLLGLLQPASGALLVDGEPLDDARRQRWQRGLGCVPQPLYLVEDSIRRNVAFARDDAEIDDARVERALRAAHLWELVESLPGKLDFVVGEDGAKLSGGERQRLGIARALYEEPAMFVMDEGTAALDYRNEAEIARVIESLAEGGTLVVIIAHRLSTLRICQRLLMLEAGRVVASGSYDELAASSAAFQALGAFGLRNTKK
ncbi:MAG: ABC transporter ATP-binding protein [Myxococcales bacterium]|nr:ABC transporter ATP-binding protein [Myxococcales bacterium]